MSMSDGEADLNAGIIARQDRRIAELEAQMEQLRVAAGWLVDDTFETEDGQALVVDPGLVRELREALRDCRDTMTRARAMLTHERTSEADEVLCDSLERTFAVARPDLASTLATTEPKP